MGDGNRGIKMFDIIQYYEDREIDFHLPGEKNVTRGWVNIQCPFRDCDDPSWHLGYNHESGLFNCHICGKKGAATYLIAVLEKCSFMRANTIIAEYEDELYISSKTDLKGSNQEQARLSPDDLYKDIRFSKLWPKLHLDYLKNRGFDPDIIIPKYRLKAVHNLGKYKFRILIPTILNRKEVSFTTRDVTDKREPKYLHCPSEKSFIPNKHCLYNIDTVKEKAMIVEGPTDVWRLGDGAIATSGTNTAKYQIQMLQNIGLKEAYIIFDSEILAQKTARQLAFDLSGSIKKIEVIELNYGDPGSLTETEANDLRTDLGFLIF